MGLSALFALSSPVQRNLPLPHQQKFFLRLLLLFVVCSVFRPAFGCCAHSKAGWNIFFSRFSSLFISNLFSDFIAEINKRRLKMNKIMSLILHIYYFIAGTQQYYSVCLDTRKRWGVAALILPVGLAKGGPGCFVPSTWVHKVPSRE